VEVLDESVKVVRCVELGVLNEEVAVAGACVELGVAVACVELGVADACVEVNVEVAVGVVCVELGVVGVGVAVLNVEEASKEVGVDNVCVAVTGDVEVALVGANVKVGTAVAEGSFVLEDRAAPSNTTSTGLKTGVATVPASVPSSSVKGSTSPSTVGITLDESNSVGSKSTFPSSEGGWTRRLVAEKTEVVSS